jgi:ABC-type antimicrobial peptide transport system permease subunit
MAYGVTQRAKELAIRLALGATRADILTRLLRGVVRVALIGSLAGSASAIVALRVLSHVAIALPKPDAVAFGSVGLAVIASITAAAYLSARRALLYDIARGIRDL